MSTNICFTLKRKAYLEEKARTMNKTQNFFVIHNYNTVPVELLEYCRDYVIYDASDDAKTKQEMTALGINYVSVENTGHNITSYFRYFAENYENLPEVVTLLKGNIIGRHCSKAYFDKVYDNKYFTYLYEDYESRSRYDKLQYKEEPSIAYLVSDSQYLELNSSWYAQSANHPHKYFSNFDDLLKFIYKDPVIPQYCLFSPGACYIVRREQIRKHSPEFYLNMNKIMNYGMNPGFPSEAHQVERMLPLIFEAMYEENEWMNSQVLFDEKLQERVIIMQEREAWNNKRFKRIRKLLGRGN